MTFKFRITGSDNDYSLVTISDKGDEEVVFNNCKGDDMLILTYLLNKESNNSILLKSDEFVEFIRANLDKFPFIKEVEQ